jgi:hypothetical protein
MTTAYALVTIVGRELRHGSGATRRPPGAPPQLRPSRTLARFCG